jgi:diguanylate cyclase (GGDEF)-like protein
MSSASTVSAASSTSADSPSILIVSESVAAASEWALHLDGGDYRIVVASALKMAQRRAAEEEFAVVVCVLPNEREGQLETAKCVRAEIRNATTPLILVAPPKSNQGEMMRALKGGPVEVVEHPVDDFVLRSKIKLFVDMHTNARRLRQLQAQPPAALNDHLTGLPLRALFLDRAAQAMRIADRGGGRVAIAVLDVSHHREVRDTLGPASADELLRQIALRLTSALRRSDTVARVDDDEFATVLACDTRDGVETVSARLDKAMAQPFAVGAHHISLAGGIGVAMFPEHGFEPEILLLRATSVMIVAKQNSLGHLFYDAIDHVDSEENAHSAEMDSEELFKVIAA